MGAAGLGVEASPAATAARCRPLPAVVHGPYDGQGAGRGGDGRSCSVRLRKAPHRGPAPDTADVTGAPRAASPRAPLRPNWMQRCGSGGAEPAVCEHPARACGFRPCAARRALPVTPRGSSRLLVHQDPGMSLLRPKSGPSAAERLTSSGDSGPVLTHVCVKVCEWTAETTRSVDYGQCSTGLA